MPGSFRPTPHPSSRRRDWVDQQPDIRQRSRHRLAPEAEDPAGRLQPTPASAAGKLGYDFAIAKDTGWLEHDREIPGFNSRIVYLPKLDISIVVLANSDIQANGEVPAPPIFGALAAVVAPKNIP